MARNAEFNSSGPTGAAPRERAFRESFEVLFDAVRRQWWIGVPLVLAGLAGGWLRHVSEPAEHQAVARVLVQRRLSSMPLEGPAGAGEFSAALEQTLSTHLLVIQSPIVLREAAAQLAALAKPPAPGLAELGLPAAPAALEARIAELVTVRRTRNNGAVVPGMIEIVAAGADARPLAPVAQAVSSAYLKYLRQFETQQIGEAIAQIENARQQLDKQLLAARQDYESFVAANGLLLRDPQGTIIASEVQHLQQLEEERRRLDEDRRKLATRLALADDAWKKGELGADALALVAGREFQRSRPEGAASASASADALVLSQLQQAELRLAELEREERRLGNLFGIESQQVRGVQSEGGAERKTIADLRGRLGAPSTEPSPAARLDGKDGARVLAALRLELRTLDKTASELDRMLAEWRPRAERHSLLRRGEQQRREALASRQAVFDRTVSRLEQLNLARDDVSLRAELVAPPVPADLAAAQFFRRLSVGAALGLLAACIAGWLAERRLAVYREPEEVRRSLGVPVLANVPPFRRRARARGFDDLLVLRRPESRVAEAIRQLRAAAMLRAGDGPGQVWQFTSPMPGDGKSTLAANLAASLALAGRRVVLIDADLRRPTQAAIFGLDPAAPGLGALLADRTVGFKDVMRPIPQAQNLWVIAAGADVAAPAELLLQPRFADVLRQLAGRFQHVIVDSPPLLPVSDAATISRNVHGVVLALRIGRTTRRQAERCMDLLEDARANVLGVVANAFAADRGALRYGYGEYVYKSGANSCYGSYLSKSRPPLAG